jgi:hypothetical protein
MTCGKQRGKHLIILHEKLPEGKKKQLLQLTNFDDSKLEAWKLIFAGVFVTHKRRASW